MNRLKELRQERGLTLDEIQNQTGIKRGTYNNYENGITKPKPETWQVLASYFNVSVPYLQGQVFKEDLDNEAQDMFEDVQDYISYVVPHELIEPILKALLNSYEYHYGSDGWK